MGDLAPAVDTASTPLPEAVEPAAPIGRGRWILLNFGSLSAGTLATRLSGLATSAILARRVSTAGYGMTGIAQTATTYFGLLSDLGLATVAVREGVQHPERLQRVISTTTGIRLALGIGAFLIALLVAPYLPFSESSRSLFRLYLLTLPIQAFNVDWVFRAIQRMHWNTILETSFAVLTLVLTAILVHQPNQILRVGGIAAFAAAATAFAGILILKGQGFHARPEFSLSAAKDYLGQSLPLCATWLAVLLYSQANTLILGAVRGESDVGLYGAALRVSQVFYQPIWLYFAAMAPALMQSWHRSMDDARRLMLESVRITAITTIGGGVIAASCGTWLLIKIFGKPYSSSGQAFEIMIWTAVVMAIGQNWSQLCIAAKRNRILVVANFLGAIVNVAICIPAASMMGIRGAALSNLLASITVTVALISAFGGPLGYKLLRSTAKPVLAGVGAYAISVATRWTSPPVSAVVSAFSYLAILLVLGEIGLRDLNRLRAMLFTRPLPSEA